MKRRNDTVRSCASDHSRTAPRTVARRPAVKVRGADNTRVAQFTPGALIFLLSALVMAGCHKQESAPAAAPTTITTPAGVEMVLVPAGRFTMGSDRGDDDEKPAHPVTVASFWMDRCEVTQKSYQSLVGIDPAKFQDPLKPVERVSWVAAIKYCNMRSMKEGLKPCYNAETADCDFSANGYRLPTEAEWEYACRAGTSGSYCFGENPGEMSGNGWVKSNAAESTHPVGQKKPNPWGLFDMYGNVAEWCNDRYNEAGYAGLSGDNPRGATKGETRVLRGGSWRYGPERSRSSARANETPALADACFGYDGYGFRCVKAAP